MIRTTFEYDRFAIKFIPCIELSCAKAVRFSTNFIFQYEVMVKPMFLHQYFPRRKISMKIMLFLTLKRVGGWKVPAALSNACHSACDKARGAILLVIVVYCLVNMWRAKNLGVVYQNFRKILVSKKKISPKVTRKF